MLLDVFGAPAGTEDLRGLRPGRRSGSPIFPAHVDDLRRADPLYETWPGWQEEIDHCAVHGGFAPAAARRIWRGISELLGCPVETISVGRTANRRFSRRRMSEHCQRAI